MTDRIPASAPLDQSPIDVRIKIAALWTTTVLIFAYVDIFSLFRADVLANIADGKMFVFSIDQTFLLFTTLYIAIPCMMISLTLLLAPKITRWANILLGAFYVLTIFGSCVGEVWIYFWVGSLIEVAFLIAIIRLAWKMPT